MNKPLPRFKTDDVQHLPLEVARLRELSEAISSGSKASSSHTPAENRAVAALLRLIADTVEEKAKPRFLG